MTVPKALTIAGSDSGGGAGIQADLKTFSAFEVFGMSAVTAVTAQNSLGVLGVLDLPPEFVGRQIDAVLEDLGADAIKTGMLATKDIVGTVAGRLRAHRGAPVVVGRMGEGPLSVIHAAAAERQAGCVVLDQDFHAAGEGPECFAYRGLRWRTEELACSLLGRHQLDNAACALAALEMAAERGARVSERALRDGLRTVRWPGRLELAGRRPDIWLDGAHNPHAAEALATYLRALRARRGEPAVGRLVLVVGMMRDKDRRGILAVLTAVPGVRQLILTRAAHPRAAAPEELAQDAAELGVPVTLKPTVGEALACARALAGEDDTICVTGSLLVAGEAKAMLEGTTVSGLRG